MKDIKDSYDEKNDVIIYHISFDQNKLKKKKQKYLTSIIKKISKDFKKRKESDKVVLTTDAGDDEIKDLRKRLTEMYFNARDCRFSTILTEIVLRTPYDEINFISRKAKQYQSLEHALFRYEDSKEM